MPTLFLFLAGPAELCVPFYKKMVEYDMVLLTHTGDERSVDAGYAGTWVFTTDTGFVHNLPATSRNVGSETKTAQVHCSLSYNCSRPRLTLYLPECARR